MNSNMKEQVTDVKEVKSGFRPRSKPLVPICHDHRHNPPMHLYIPHDQEYVHVCPSCGATVIIYGQEIIF